MRVLKISYNNREVARASLTKTSLILGRSPVCDLVVRFAGIRPVHLLFEYLGSDAFKPNQGEWSITDVSGLSGRDVEMTSSGMGQGIVLDDAKAVLGKFSFEWVDDKLSETALEGGALREQVKILEADTSKRTGQLTVLEVIMVNSERDRVEDILHIDLKKGMTKSIGELPPVELDWNPGDSRTPVQIRVTESQNSFQFYQKGTPLDVKEVNGTKRVPLGSQDLIQVHWQLHDYYFRLVSEIEAPPTPIEIRKDPFYRNLGIVLLVFLILLYLLVEVVPEKQIEPTPPPRIARVEVKRAAPPPQEEPQPEAPQPTPTPPKQAQAEEKPQQNRQQAKVAPAPPAKASPKKGVALDTPAPKANVNQVGLLGSLKPQKSQNTVKADMVFNQGAVSQTVSGDKGFVVKQPPSGVLGAKTQQKQAQLADASTTVAGGDRSSAKNLGPIVDSSSTGGSFSIGYGSFADSGDGRDAMESVEGGLDKETVRRTLNQYRKEIKTCYDRALVLKPRISGRVVYQWTITGKGATTSSRQLKSSLDSPSLESCVLQVLQGIRWPESKNGSPTIVKYPFEFQKKN